MSPITRYLENSSNNTIVNSPLDTKYHTKPILSQLTLSQSLIEDKFKYFPPMRAHALKRNHFSFETFTSNFCLHFPFPLFA